MDKSPAALAATVRQVARALPYSADPDTVSDLYEVATLLDGLASQSSGRLRDTNDDVIEP